MAIGEIKASIAGNSEIADLLLGLYLTGKKTAGSSLLKDYELAGDPIPKVGDHWIVLDSSQTPRCILKTVRVEVRPFAEMTEAVAIAEGEGDLSLAYWKSTHEEFFSFYLQDLGIEDIKSALVVTEFYEKVYS